VAGGNWNPSLNWARGPGGENVSLVLKCVSQEICIRKNKRVLQWQRSLRPIAEFVFVASRSHSGSVSSSWAEFAFAMATSGAIIQDRKSVGPAMGLRCTCFI